MSNIDGEIYNHHHDGSGQPHAASSITTYPILPLTTRSNPYFCKVYEDALVVQHPPSHHPPQSAVHSSTSVPMVRRQYNVTGVLSSNHDLFNHITLPLVVGLEEASPLSPSASSLLIASPDCSRPSSPSCNEALSTHQNMIASVLHGVLIGPFEEQVYDRPVIHCAVFAVGANASPRSATAGSALYDLLLQQPSRQQQEASGATTDPERLLEVRVSTIEEAQDFCSEAAMLLTARYKHQVGGTNNLTKRYESPVFNLAPNHHHSSINKPDPLDRHNSALFIRLRIGSDGESPSEGIEKEFLLGDLGSHRDVLECALLSLRQQQQGTTTTTTRTTPPKVALSNVLLKHTTSSSPTSSSLRSQQQRQHSHTTMVVAVPSFTTPNPEGLRGPNASLQFLHNVLFDTPLPLANANASSLSMSASSHTNNTTTTRRAPETSIQQQQQPRSGSGGLRDQLLSELNPHNNNTGSTHGDGPSSTSNFSMYQNASGGGAAVPGTILGGNATYHPPSRRSTTRSPSEALPSPTFDNFAPTTTTTPTKPTIIHQRRNTNNNNGLVGTPVSSSTTTRRPTSSTNGGGVPKESIYHGNDVSTTSTRNVNGTTTTPVRRASIQPPSSVYSNATTTTSRKHSTSIADLQSQQQEHQSEINRLNSQLVHSVTDNDSLRIDYLDLKRELVNTKEALVVALGELQDARHQIEQQHLQLQLHRGLQPDEENIIEMGDVSSISSSDQGDDAYDYEEGIDDHNNMPPHQPVTVASSSLGPSQKKKRSPSHRSRKERRSSTTSITKKSGGGVVVSTQQPQQQTSNSGVNVVVNKELEGVVKSLYGRIADMETTYDSDLDIMHALRRENHALSSQNDIMKQRSAELEAEINKLKKAETARLRQKALERIYPGPTSTTAKGNGAVNGKAVSGRAASASSAVAKQREDSKSRSPQHPSSNASEADSGATPTSAQLKTGLVSAQAAELTSMRRRVAALENQNADLRRSVSMGGGGGHSHEGSEAGGGGGDSRSVSYAMSADPQPFDLLSLEKEVQSQVTTVLDQHLREKENEISELRDLLSRNPRVSRGTDRFCCVSDSMVSGLRALNIQLDVIDRRRRTELLAEFEEAAGGPLSRDPEDAQRRKDLISKMKKDKVLLCVLQQRDVISNLQTKLTENIASTTPHDVPEIIPTTASGADVETLEKNVVWELGRVSTLKDLVPTFRDTCAALDQLKTIA